MAAHQIIGEPVGKYRVTPKIRIEHERRLISGDRLGRLSGPKQDCTTVRERLGANRKGKPDTGYS